MGACLSWSPDHPLATNLSDRLEGELKDNEKDTRKIPNKVGLLNWPTLHCNCDLRITSNYIELKI